MIRMLVFSDTHSDYEYMKRIVMTIPEVSHIIHLGDHMVDIKKVNKEYPQYDYHYVAGNCDFLEKNTEELFQIGQYNIFITHGHKYGVKTSLQRLFYKAKEVNAKICLFGHTHISHMEEIDGVVLFNPGSLTRGLNGNSYGIIEIEDGKIGYDVIPI